LIVMSDMNQPVGALLNVPGAEGDLSTETLKEPVLKKLKSGTGIKTNQTSKRKEYRKKVKKQTQHGTWKLVYADFVTVLMAFFIVVWVMLFDNIAKRERIDTSCIEPLAEELKKTNQWRRWFANGQDAF